MLANSKRRSTSIAIVVVLLACSLTGCGAPTEKKAKSVTGGSGPEVSGRVAPGEHDTSEPSSPSSALPPQGPEVPAAPPVHTGFDVQQAISHVSYLADSIGPRVEGSLEEARAAQYLEEKLREYGYSPAEQAVPLPLLGQTSKNVVATLPGGQRPQNKIVIGAHIDTRNKNGPCPGANDNATGCAVVLELARILNLNRRTVPSIDFVFFAGEEITPGGSSSDHHYGSSVYVENLGAGTSAIAGMISVDMVGFGPDFVARSMLIAPRTMTDLVLETGSSMGLIFLQDTASTGMSDHEPFEKAGIPSVWVEWRDDPGIHGPQDNFAHVDASKVRQTGELLQRFCEEYLTPERTDLLTNY